MSTVREGLLEFLARNQQTIIELGTDWVIRQAIDLRGRRPRYETRRLVDSVFEFNRDLLLADPSGQTKRAAFIDFVTSYRAAHNFHISTLLRGFLSFRKGFLRVLHQSQLLPDSKLLMLEKVDEIYFESIFGMSDIYVDKLKAIIEDRQAQLRERDLQLAHLERELTESLLKRFLAPRVVDEIVSGKRSIDQKPKSMHVTILFADLVGFTELIQDISSDRLSEFLNQYLATMSEQIFYHKGTVDKFMGDTLMAVFGAPIVMPVKEQIALSIRCASNMQRALLEIDEQFDESGHRPEELTMRIGIDSGPSIVGSFGSVHRSDFTAIGMHVNRARKLHSKCPPGEILVTGSVARYMPGATEPYGTLQLKGFKSRTGCFRVLQSQVTL